MEINTVAMLATPTMEASTPTQPVGLASASARFSALMEAEAPSNPAAVTNVAATEVLLPPPVESSTLGDAILGSVRQMSSDFSFKWSQVQQLVDQEVTSIQDLLRMQIAMTQASVQYEMVGKAISKSTQNFDQLVRLQ